MKKAFTLIELIFVIILVGIVSSVALNRFSSNNELKRATTQIINHINYTKHLAMIDDKFTPVPHNINDINQEDGSKYWFKKWWQIGFRVSNNTRYYVVMSDSSRAGATSNFNGSITSGQFDEEVALDPHTQKYLIGVWSEDMGSSFPNKEFASTNLNLTMEYKINNISISDTDYRTSTNGIYGDTVTLLFDYMGRPYFDHGDTGDNGDINPYEWAERKMLRTRVYLTITHANEGNSYICIEPITGYVREVTNPTVECI